ncbi:flagellar hook-associated protein FlgL [Gallaecimonas xiamenensis]|uniref:Flagellar hook-associated protein FlgL n=1 Tax=Gallaecimonas xiamenensis 3-C-1 TaxID=745411 RepID=K2KDQ9_9GAMM|nr:flagellar hook-associated protein FlgL [Gallaecimonas xiamenensis]EKE75445.1 flagellar hook-associated protein FlgL [Gallaecimonas xiamenensis 3-C-1]
MRISTNMIYQSGLNNILSTQELLVRLRDQASTQQRILQPADDPAGAGTVLRLTEQLGLSEQFRKNGDNLKSRFGIAETSLSSMTDALAKARTLMVQAQNGVNGPDEREALASELLGIRDHLQDLMNTQDANGDYIFSGNAGKTAPYQKIAGQYVYQGDQGRQNIQVSQGFTINANFPGFDLFDNLDPSLGATGTLTAGAGTVTTGVRDEGGFDAFYRANYDPNNPAGNTFSVTTAAGAPDTYQITDSGGTVLASGNYVPGEPIDFNGLDITLDGAAGASADITLDAPVRDNILDGLTTYAAQLSDPSRTLQQRQEDAAYIQSLAENTYNSVVSAQGIIGGRVNVLDNLSSSSEAMDVVLQSNRADIAEVDIAETVSKLAQQQTVMQAAYSGFQVVNSLTLFDYVR